MYAVFCFIITQYFAIDTSLKVQTLKYIYYICILLYCVVLYAFEPFGGKIVHHQ